MCSKCNQNNCGCNSNVYEEVHICNQCSTSTEPCDCPIIDLSTDCVLYNQDEIACGATVVVPKNTTLSIALQSIVSWACTKFTELANYLRIINVGTGVEVYAGDNLIGEKKLRKLNSDSTILTITQNTDDITFGVDETELNTFIEDNQKTYTVDNVGTGVEIYKDSTIVGDNTQFNLRTIVEEDQGTGESFLRDIQQTTDEVKFRVKTVVSDNLTITSTDEEVRIETPMTAVIPALYVNNLYEPTYNEWLTENTLQNGIPIVGFEYIGKGTLAQPFTDTTVYTLNSPATPPTITSNTSIQNALDGDTVYSYVGTGTRLSPQKTGQKITIQDNSNFYVFPGDFGYENINIKFEATVLCTTVGYLIDMDNPLYFDTENGTFNIEIVEGKQVQITDSLGFRNSGNTSTTPPSFTSGRIGYFIGDGAIYSPYSGVAILTRYIFNGDGNNNDDNLHFSVRCKVRADQQGIYFTKNKMRIDFYNQLESGILLGSGDISLKAFHMTGGQIRFYEKGSIYLGNDVSGRTYGITFEPENDGIGFCSFQLNSASITGNSENCFVKLNDELVDFLAFNSSSGAGFATTLVGTNTVTDGLFENLGVTPWSINFKNNVFSFTGIDQTKVDLTQGNTNSTINFIGNNIIESLVIYDDRAAAILAGLPLYSAYLKTNGVAYPTTSGWIRDIVLPA